MPLTVLANTTAEVILGKKSIGNSETIVPMEAH